MMIMRANGAGPWSGGFASCRFHEGIGIPAILHQAPCGSAGSPAAPFSSTISRTMRLLARRPFHAAPAQEVKVDVKDRLAPVFSAIRDDSKTILRDSAFPGDFIRNDENRADQFLVGILYFVERLHVSFGDDQNMCGRRRVGVFKCKQCVVFIHFFAGDLAGYDFAKDAGLHVMPPEWMRMQK